MSDVEQRVRQFYDSFGWQGSEGQKGEDKLFRELSRPYYGYHARVDERTRALFAGLTGKLLIGGGGDIPESHLQIAAQFSEVSCLDISQQAIAIAKAKLGPKSDCAVGSLLDIPKPDNSFDAAFCAHVIYHIDQTMQAKAVRELIRVVRPGGKIVIIYRNPGSTAERALKLLGRTPFLWRLTRTHDGKQGDLYFYAHDLRWWQQFADQCAISYYPWDVLSAHQEKALLIKGPVAWLFYRICSWLEAHSPQKAVKRWSYPVILLIKT